MLIEEKMNKIINFISSLYSSIITKYSFFEEEKINSWTLMLPGSGCEYHKKTGGCTMCGFYKSTDKYAKGMLFPGFIFKTLFSLAQRAVESELPREIFIFNGGSFLNDKEIPVSFRHYLYDQVSKSNHLDRLIIESRCEYITDSKIAKAVCDLNGKKLVIGIGLESQDDYIRNIVINKSLTKTMFQEKVALLKRYGVDVLAYIFLKPSGLSEKEAYKETIETIKYALSIGVREIALSCAFVQEGTKMAEDFHKGNFRPPYLWTILEIIKEINANNWPVSIGGFSDEPPPISAPANCLDCSPQIYLAIEKFRQDRILGSIPTCDCYEKWKNLF